MECRRPAVAFSHWVMFDIFRVLSSPTHLIVVINICWFAFYESIYYLCKHIASLRWLRTTYLIHICVSYSVYPMCMLIGFETNRMFCYIFTNQFYWNVMLIERLLVLEFIVNKSQVHSLHFQVEPLDMFNLEWKEKNCLGHNFQKCVPLSDVSRCYF